MTPHSTSTGWRAASQGSFRRCNYCDPRRAKRMAAWSAVASRPSGCSRPTPSAICSSPIQVNRAARSVAWLYTVRLLTWCKPADARADVQPAGVEAPVGLLERATSPNTRRAASPSPPASARSAPAAASSARRPPSAAAWSTVRSSPLLFHGALRRSEVASLRWVDVDLSDGDDVVVTRPPLEVRPDREGVRTCRPLVGGCASRSCRNAAT